MRDSIEIRQIHRGASAITADLLGKFRWDEFATLNPHVSSLFGILIRHVEIVFVLVHLNESINMYSKEL